MLNYHHINSDAQGRYLCLREIDGYIIVGSEQGNLSLWNRDVMINQLIHAHSAAVCCLEVDRPAEVIISGGKEGIILLLKI